MARSASLTIVPTPGVERVLQTGAVINRPDAVQPTASSRARVASAAYSNAGELPNNIPGHAAPITTPNLLATASTSIRSMLAPGTTGATGGRAPEQGLTIRPRAAIEPRQRVIATLSANRADVNRPVDAVASTDTLLSRVSTSGVETMNPEVGLQLTQQGGSPESTVSVGPPRGIEMPGPANGRSGAEIVMTEAAKLETGGGVLPEQMVQRVLQAQAQNQNLLRIQLQPLELGHLEIQLRVQGDQLNLTFTAQQAATKELLESYLPNLRQLLGDTGVQLGDVDVKQQDQSPGQSTERGNDRRASYDQYDELAHTADADAHAPRASHDGLIDAFA